MGSWAAGLAVGRDWLLAVLFSASPGLDELV